VKIWKLVDLISHSNQVIFAVVDKDKRLVGVVHFNNIRVFNTYRVKYTLVKNIMAVPTEIIYPFNTMETVMNKFERSKVAFYRS
jgi:CIC family chloride channel protein